MVLHGQLCGRVGRCRVNYLKAPVLAHWGFALSVVWAGRTVVCVDVLWRSCLRSFNELLQSPRALKALVASGSLLGLLLLGLLIAPSLVRGRVEREARARGLAASVGAVRWGSSGVWLRDVRVTSPGDSVELAVDAVNVGVFSGRVRAIGGRLQGKGDVEPILKKLRGRSAAKSEGTESGRELSVEGLQIRWERDAALLEVWGARARRSGGELTFGADLARARLAKSSLEARDVALGALSKDGHRRLVRLETTSVDVSWVSDAAPAPEEEAKVSARAPSADAEEPDARLERAAKLRGLRALLLPLLRDGLAEDAQLGLDGISARVERGGETLSFGPSRLALQREVDTLRVSLTPNATEVGITPLALNVSMPLAEAPIHVIAKGGPVSFASLGVRAGQMGLGDVRQATLAVDGVADFSQDFESVDVEGKLAVRGLVLQRKELSRQPVGPWGFDVSLSARARLDGRDVEVTSSEAHVGELRAELTGRVEDTPGRRHVEGRLRVPLSGCQSVLEAAPRGLLPLVRDMRLSGSFGIDLQVRYDALAPKDTRVVLSVQNECKVQGVPVELNAQRFSRPFMREVKAPDGSSMTIESGPGTPSWVSIDDMSRHLETAVLICEDSRFHAHAGFDFLALENALKDDLKQGRFARGASTVSMQLAKNLYLGMEKTLGRKLQEALLTVLLEQQLDKRRILELYLNVVELGPGLYGVGDAAQYYFATPARALSLGQALYLASILPNPTYSRFGPDGRLKPQWLSYLHRLMHIAHKIKRIDDGELQLALEEEIAFRVPAADATTLAAPLGEDSEERAPPELEPEGP
jgi:hypothetical protein